MTQRLKSILQKIKEHPKLSIGITVSLLLTFLIRKQQHRLIYQPNPPGMPRSPQANQFRYRNPYNHDRDINYRDIEVRTSDGVTLKGWYMFNDDFDQLGDRLILYFHQNAGNIGARLPFIRNLIMRTKSDVMIVAYRGYSDSQGKPSQKGLKQDGIAILNKAIEYAKRKKIPLIVYGRSLGGAVAIHSCSQLASQQQVKGLILQNTFTSISDVAVHLFGKIFPKFLLKFFFLFLISNHWQSYKLISTIKSPVLFIKSEQDELVPIQQMNQLEKLCKATHYEYVMKNATHNETWNLDLSRYLFQVNKFLSKL